MNYDCYGDKCPFNGTAVDTYSSEVVHDTRYRITVSRTNPTRNAYYSESDPIESNRAMLLIFGVGLHEIAYTIQGVRNSTGKKINITDYKMVDPYS